MKHKIAILAGLLPLAVGVATSGSALAQTIYVAPRVYAAPPPMVVPILPPHEVLAMVRAAGFSPLTAPARRGVRYVLLASDRAGGQVRIVVNGRRGTIVQVTPTYDARFAYAPARPPVAIPGARARHAEPQLELSGAPPAQSAHAPPRPVARVANAPESTAARPRPERTPLPRPRPQIASNDAAPPPADTVEAASPPAAAAAAAADTAAVPPPAGSVVPTPRFGRGAARNKPAETPMVPVAPLE